MVCLMLLTIRKQLLQSEQKKKIFQVEIEKYAFSGHV